MQLLPAPERKFVRTEYRLRLATVMLGLVFLALLAGSIFLVPSYLLSAQKESASMESARVLKDAIALRGKDDRAGSLKLSKDKMNALVEGVPLPPANELMAVALRRQSAGIHLTLVSATLSVGTRTLLLAGIADGRAELLAFRKAVEGEKIFSSVAVPVSDFAKDSGLSFSLSAAVVSKKQ